MQWAMSRFLVFLAIIVVEFSYYCWASGTTRDPRVKMTQKTKSNPFGVDYCAISSDHTMCKYEDKPGPNCGNPDDNSTTSYPLPEDLQEAVLDEHNMLRSAVALGEQMHDHSPKAADMMKMEWNQELSLICYRWLLQCGYEVGTPHDKCRDIVDDGDILPVGQNMSFISVSGGSISMREELGRGIQKYFEEVYDMTDGDFTGTDRQMKNMHYTQLVWGGSRYLGCACHQYKKPNSKDTWTTGCCCNYGIAGNWDNVPLYTPGRPCSQCPEGSFCSKTYKGLCTYDPEDKYDKEERERRRPREKPRRKRGKRFR